MRAGRRLCIPVLIGAFPASLANLHPPLPCAAASPCPPPPPPVFDDGCPVPAAVVSGTMSPGCYQNDCNTWGIQKAYDGKTQGTRTLAHSEWTSGNPYFQLYLGASAPNVTAVRLVARGDGWLYESQYLSVYVSATTSWTGSTATLCAANVVPAALGETVTVLCPVGFAWKTRYVTVLLNSTANPKFNGYLSLQEVTPLYDGEAASRSLGARAHAHAGPARVS